MKNLKRIFTMIFPLILTNTLVSCGGGSGYDINNFLPKGTSENPYQIVKEPVEITIFAPHSSGNPDYKDLTMFKHLSKITNLKFRFVTPDSSAYITTRASVWSNVSSIPDLFLFNNPISEQIQFMENRYDAYVPFNDSSFSSAAAGNVWHVIDNYMPAYKALLDKNFNIPKDEANDAIKTATLSDGKMYSALSVSDVSRDLTFKMFINENWINNLNEDYNLGLPTPQNIATVEDYVKILKAFKKYDANRNGDPDDEIPLSSKSLEYLRNFILSSYGYVSGGVEIKDDGSAYEFVPYTESYRKYLILMHELYAEGILHNSTFSITTDAQLSKYGNKGQLGSFVSAAAYIAVGYGLEKQYVTFGPLVSSYYGGPKKQLGFSKFKPDGACIPQASPYVREVARLLDIMYSDLGTQLISYGVEGENWKWDDESHSSWSFLVPENWTGNQEQYRATITPNVNSASALYWSKDFVEKMNDDILNHLNKMSASYVPYLKVPEPYSVKMNSAEYAKITKIKASLDPQIKYLEASYIRGDDGADPSNDSSYDRFVNTLRGYQVDEMMECYSDSLKRSKK